MDQVNDTPDTNQETNQTGTEVKRETGSGEGSETNQEGETDQVANQEGEMDQMNDTPDTNQE